MTRRSLPLSILLLVLGVAGGVMLLPGCSGVGDQLVDPATNHLTPVSLFAVSTGSGSKILHYSEVTGLLTPDSLSFDRSIDAIYTHGDRVYLHHRDLGSVTVLDLANRRRVAEINGFPAKGDGQMCAMAFSNSSQAWIACNDARSLFHVDTKFNVIADTIPLPLPASHVGAVDTLVFVCMKQPDGRGLVSILKSNTGGVFDVEHSPQFSVDSPVIYSAPTTNRLDMVLLTAGGPGVAPKMYYINTETLEISFDNPLEIDPLADYIGKEPTFAASSLLDNIYLSTPTAVLQIPYGQAPYEWLPGNYPVIGVDHDTDLLYAFDPESRNVKRINSAAEQLDDIAVGADLRAILVIGSNIVP